MALLTPTWPKHQQDYAFLGIWRHLRETDDFSWFFIQMGSPAHIWYHCLEDNLALSFNPIIQITLCWSIKGRVPGWNKILVLAKCNNVMQKFNWTRHLCVRFEFIMNMYCSKHRSDNHARWSRNVVRKYCISMEFKQEIKFTYRLMPYHGEILYFDVYVSF